MPSINTASEVAGTASVKKRLYCFLTVFVLAGIILAIYMTYCQINFTTIAEVNNNNINMPVLTVNGEQTDVLPDILTYFENCSQVTLLTVGVVLAVLAALILPFFTLNKCDLKCETPNSIFTVFASSLLGFLFAGYVVNYIITPLRPLWTEVQLPGPDVASMGNVLKIIYYAGIVCAIPCAVYFLYIATQNKFKPEKKMCVLSVFPVVWLTLRLVFYFMSTSAHVNLSGRKLYIVSMVFAIIFFLQDSKRWIPENKSSGSDKKIYGNSKLFFATGIASVVTFLIYHLSTTYLQAFWIFGTKDSYLLNGIFISMILFILFRIASVHKVK